MIEKITLTTISAGAIAAIEVIHSLPIEDIVKLIAQLTLTFVTLYKLLKKKKNINNKK